MTCLGKYLLLSVMFVAVLSSCAPGKTHAPAPEGPGEIPEEPVNPPPADTDIVPGQPDWAELPMIEEREDVLYITHYVTGDGMNDVVPETEAEFEAARRNVTIAFDTNRRMPVWVAFPMHTWYWNPAGAKRTDDWAYDPLVPETVQPDIIRGSYRQNAPDGAFSRGHLLASADRLRSEPMNRQTFFVTNIAPQVQEGFNNGLWETLEERVRGWSGSSTDTLYCVTGVAFEGDKETFDRSGVSIPVPSHYYKVLLQRKNRTDVPLHELPASELRCIGFWFDNAATSAALGSFALSVADIEERVGIEFFPMLPDEVAEEIKSAINKSDWGIK